VCSTAGEVSGPGSPSGEEEAFHQDNVAIRKVEVFRQHSRILFPGGSTGDLCLSIVRRVLKSLEEEPWIRRPEK